MHIVVDLPFQSSMDAISWRKQETYMNIFQERLTSLRDINCSLPKSYAIFRSRFLTLEASILGHYSCSGYSFLDTNLSQEAWAFRIFHSTNALISSAPFRDEFLQPSNKSLRSNVNLDTIGKDPGSRLSPLSEPIWIPLSALLPSHGMWQSYRTWKELDYDWT